MKAGPGRVPIGQEWRFVSLYQVKNHNQLDEIIENLKYYWKKEVINTDYDLMASCKN